MSKSFDPKPTFSSVGMSITLDAKSNELLTKSISASKRTKRSEAALRLADHLRRFPSISRIDLVEEES